MVYLIHFQEKLHHAQHYIGFVAGGNKALENRWLQHVNNCGAKILRACNLVGIEYEIVKVWRKGDRSFERWLKKKKKARCMCPVCKGLL